MKSFLLFIAIALLFTFTPASADSNCEEACRVDQTTCINVCNDVCRLNHQCFATCSQECGANEDECVDLCNGENQPTRINVKVNVKKVQQIQSNEACLTNCLITYQSNERACPIGPDGVAEQQCLDEVIAEEQACQQECGSSKKVNRLAQKKSVKSVAHLHWPHHHHGGKKHHFWPDIKIIHHAEEEIKHAFEQYIRDYAKQYAQDEYPVAYNNFASAYDMIKSWNAGTHRFELDFNVDSDKSADDLPDEPEGKSAHARLFGLHWGHHHHWWPHIHIPHRDIERLKHTFEGYVRDFAKAYLQAEFPIAYAAFSDVYDVVEAWKADRHRFQIIYGIYSDLTDDQVPDDPSASA